MKWNTVLIIPVAASLMVAVHPPAFAETSSQKTVTQSAAIFTEMMNNPKTRIPAEQLRRSEAIAIIPKVVQAGFIFGGRRGTGVLMTHRADGTWSNPVFVNVTGGSVGLQAGAKSSDMVLVFPTRKGLDKVLTGGSLELGGNVTGTVGKTEGSVVSTLDDKSGGDKIYAYTRSSGVFGSAAFEGAELGLDNPKNREFYGSDLTASQILAASGSNAPVVASSLKQVIDSAEAGN
jgi:SH3 domain-containing YSC84-like protein 1